MKIIIPSYNRAGKVKTIDLFPEAIIVVPESQKKEYQRYYKNVEAIPDKEDGSVSKKRNAVLKRYKGDLFVIDDDVLGVVSHKGENLTGLQVKILIENGYRLAKELGCGMWGLNPSSDKMKINDFQPFSLTKQVYYGIGIMEDDIRYDEGFTQNEDVDFWLQKLNRYRKVLRYNLYSWKVSGSKIGGIPDRRQLDNNQRLIKKWGRRIVDEKDGKLKVHTPLKGV